MSTPIHSGKVRQGRQRRRRAEEGASATEYALLMTLLALVVFAGIGAFGLSVNTWYQDLVGAVDAALS